MRATLRALALVLALLGGGVAGRPPARADFNDILTGARPAGMGGAFVALADDVNALYWNPAGLTLSRHMQLGFMNAEELVPTGGSSVGTDFLGWTSGHGEHGAAGLAFLRQGLSDILQERTVSLSYGYALNPFTRVGANLKSLALTTRPVGRFFPDPALADSSTLGLDLGLIHVVTPQLRFGFLARNIGARLGTVLREDVHRTYRLGLAYKFYTELIDEDYLWFTFDLFTKEDIDDQAGVKIRTGVGVEYQVTPWLALRAGADRGFFTAGGGVTAFDLSLDYAFEQAREGVGNSQRISLTYRFGSAIVSERRVTHVRHRPPPPVKPAPRPERPPARPRRPEG
jgi:hypothetical protein